MPTTASESIPYPDDNDAPLGSVQMAAIATKVDASFASLKSVINDSLAVPLCRLILPSNFVVANNDLNVAVPFGSGSELFKTHASMHSVTTNNTRIIPPKPGYYRCTFHPGWDANTNGYRAWQIGKNGVRQSPEMKTSWQLQNLSFAGPAVSQVVRCLSTADYLEAFAFQQSGSPLILRGGNIGDMHASMFEVQYIRTTAGT